MASTEQVPAASIRRAPRGPSLLRRLRRGFDRWWFAYAMLLPVVVVMGVLVFYPLARGIAFSFTNADRYTIGGQDIPSTYQYIGAGELQAARRRPELLERDEVHGGLDVRQRLLPLHGRARARAAAEPHAAVPRRLPDAPAHPVGGADVHQRTGVALPLQRPQRLLRPGAARDRDRRPGLARRSDLGEGFRDRGERLGWGSPS